MAVHDAPIVIKKVKKVIGGGHHGGAWKVAYADFVTAMMAFFLLMWLLNVTTKVQKQGIADYFAPAQVSESTSGAGGILGGTALGDDNSKSSGSASVVQNAAPQASDDQALHAADSDQMKQQQARDSAAFTSAAESIRQALNSRPDLAELSKQVVMDNTPEGLRIQLIDQDGRSMFNQGSTEPNDRAKALLRLVAGVISRLPNRINIYGHSSADGDGARPNSIADRRISTNRTLSSLAVLEQAGVQDDRVSVTGGKGSSDPLYADDPTLAGNRRIAIVLLHEAPVLPTPGT